MILDELGAGVMLDGVPRRVVSLVPSLSETLASWGISPVGVTDWCIAPEFPDATRVRGTKNPDLAVIQRLAPDLVIANQEENRRVDVERLREAGVPVYVTAPDTLAQVADTFQRLGVVLGVEQPASQLAAEIRDALDVPVTAALQTFCPVWRDPWIAVGTGTIAADLLAHAGFLVVPDEPRYPRVELDAVAEVDVVLLPDEPYNFGPADAAEFAGWRATVRLVDGAALTWWGPRTVAALANFRALASELSS